MIPPALTPEQWAARAIVGDSDGWGPAQEARTTPSQPENAECMRHWVDGRLRVTCEECVTWHFGASFDAKGRHAVAALALHEQPFGFTWDDVAMLRILASPPDAPPYFPMLDLADRIAALLPPP